MANAVRALHPKNLFKESGLKPGTEVEFGSVNDSQLRLRTGVWYHDNLHALSIPPHWDVSVFYPRTPPPLTDAQIEEALEHPCGQPPLRELCRDGSWRRPLIEVDDPNRPTPACRVIPIVLRHFGSAGIASRDVRILVASGTHGPARRESLLQKLGPQAESCQILIHDACRDLVSIGKTSQGTPVSVNRQVTESDFVLGIGGIYPNHSTGFGGGSKLALGVLGLRSIMALHCRHRELGWGSVPGEDSWCIDLDEIARMIGLKSLISLQVDCDHNVVRVATGDHSRYYAQAVAFARQAFEAPSPEGADVVISNAYPFDLSLTFARKKGIYPLSLCPPHASRIVVAACSEGHGFHRLVPYVNYPRFHRRRHLCRRATLMTPRELAGKLTGTIERRMRRLSSGKKNGRTGPRLKPIWLYRTSPRADSGCPDWFFVGHNP